MIFATESTKSFVCELQQTVSSLKSLDRRAESWDIHTGVVVFYPISVVIVTRIAVLNTCILVFITGIAVLRAKPLDPD